MRRALLAVLAFAALAAPVGAQSLFNASGLGLPTDPLDARTRAVGNLGIGLMGGGLVPTDPAAAAGLGLASGVLTVQPSWVDFTRAAGESGSFQGSRFPLAGLAYPIAGQNMLYVTFGAHLDQRYAATRDVTINLASGSGIATDRFEQEGGVANINVGIARVLAPDVTAGLSVGRYSGSVVRSLERELDDVNVVGQPTDFQEVGRWGYAGTQVTGGVALRVGTVARLAGSATWSGELDATADETTGATSRSYSLPLELRVGGSALLAPGLALNASLTRADWSVTSSDLSVGTAAATLRYGAGLELTRARLFGAVAPLRVGYRRGGLPFDTGGGAPSESVVSGGLGLTFGDGSGFAAAGADLSVERGTRSDALLSESFWRATFSLRVAGF